MLMDDVRLARLDNGLRVAASAVPHVDSVTVGIWVAAGSRHEPRELCGISHFIEHMLFKGTRRRSAAEISRGIEGRGGYLNAFTQEESTCYYAQVAADRLKPALDVLCDLYLQPRLATRDIVRERAVVLDEIQMYRDQPPQRVHELLDAALWKGHALGRPVTREPDSLKAIGRNRIIDYRRRFYGANRTVFAFAGRIDHGECVNLVSRMAGRLGRSGGPAWRRVTGRVGQDRLAVETKDTEQAHVALGVRLFGRHDPRRSALRLLNAILGENMSSRLFLVLRERHGLAYSIQSSCQLFADTGVLVVSAGLDPARLARGLELIGREMARIRDQAVGRAELRRAIDYATGQLRLGLEGTSHQMQWMGEHLMAYGRIVKPAEVIRELESVSSDDIRAVARDVFRTRRMSLAVVGPKGMGSPRMPLL